MIYNQKITPITGSFVNMLISDTGIINYGLQEWEQDFQMMKLIGIDHIFIIRTEYEQNGVMLSAEDPRSTTWQEDDNLLNMVFRLGDKYDMNVYLGGPVSITNLHLGDWKKEVDDNKRYYERTVNKYKHHICFKGLYVSLEALPWHFNFFDICIEILKFLRKTYPDMKTFMSPSFGGPTGDMKTHYTVDKWIDIYGNYFFKRVAGLLDYCAPQDKIAAPMCHYGEIISNDLEKWYEQCGKLFDDCGIELWSNVETFQRPFPGHGEPPAVFRQADYRTLYMKLANASIFAKKLVTYEFSSCMSPNTEWGSSRRLLARYLEIIGRPVSLIEKVYGK